MKKKSKYLPPYEELMEKGKMPGAGLDILRITKRGIPREKNFYADELSKAELINHNVQFKIQPHAK